MANIFRREIPGVKIEFCTNWGGPYGNSGTPTDYWPGSQYVDIISQDIYQKNLGGDWNHAMTSGTYNVNWMVNFAKQNGIKVALSEWGAYGDDASYINDPAKWMNSLGNLFAYTSYSQYEPADQVVNKGENPNEQAAWIQQWSDTYYSPTL